MHVTEQIKNSCWKKKKIGECVCVCVFLYLTRIQRLFENRKIKAEYLKQPLLGLFSSNQFRNHQSLTKEFLRKLMIGLLN